ncbi:MAG: toxin-antitoxin system YwqK family antitoxin [Flavobacteriales bacterium]
MKNILIVLVCIFIFYKTGYSQLIKDKKVSNSEINQLNNDKEKVGLWFSYGKQGIIVKAEYYEKGILNGPFESYYENGKIEHRGYYKNGTLDSVLTVYSKNGIILSESNYSRGLLNGLMMYYNEKGVLISRENYLDGFLDTNYNDNYENPPSTSDNLNLKIIEKYDTLVTNKVNEDWNKDVTIYRNDSIVAIINYYKDEILVKTYFDNDIVTKRIYYQEKDPRKLEKIVYFEGEQFPRIEMYDENGKLIK